MKAASAIRLRSGVLVACACVSLIAGTARAQALSDYQVKAAYFYNFAKFVNWPTQDLSDSSAPLRFCIFRDHFFEAELNRIVKGKTVAGHPIQVLQVDAPEDSRKCNSLFVSSLQQRQNKHLLELLRGSSVLTVGETEDFVARGGIIAFVLENDRVQFVVNRRAANEAGLTMSSKVLSLAKQVVN